MTKLPTTEKPSIKDTIVSGLLLGIKSFDRAVMTHWQLLFIGLPPVMTVISMSLGYLTAPEPCRQSFDCVELHIVKSTKPLFNWIEELQSIPDDSKLPVLIAIACVLLYAFAVFVYASQDLVAPLRLKSNQDDDAG